MKGALSNMPRGKDSRSTKGYTPDKKTHFKKDIERVQMDYKEAWYEHENSHHRGS